MYRVQNYREQAASVEDSEIVPAASFNAAPLHHM